MLLAGIHLAKSTTTRFTESQNYELIHLSTLTILFRPVEANLRGETNITIAAARYIGSRNWRVISIALPRGGSGLSFVPDDSRNQSIIPDIVAIHSVTGNHIFIESKPKFSKSDVDKLRAVRRGEYSSSILAALGCESTQVLLAIAFSGQPVTGSFESLGLDCVFHYDDQGNIATLYQGIGLEI
jgi:hypothetical protein